MKNVLLRELKHIDREDEMEAERNSKRTKEFILKTTPFLNQLKTHTYEKEF